ncbi:Phosphoglucose isomerase (PGI) [Candidatus Magnetoovum chiemensis]|nr:Phosphoglucose isomerase (PGI) [Candidatus Magnetoovum chiemensis]
MLELYFANMIEDVIGKKGLSFRQIESVREKVSSAHKQIQERKWEELSFLDLCKQDTSDIKELAKYIKDTSEYFILLGIGGSATGPRAIIEALKPYQNYINSPKIFICDNVDPRTLNSILSVVDITKTTVNVVTKSGTTAETIASFMVLWNYMERTVGKDIADKFIVSTNPDRGLMNKIIKERSLKSLPIPNAVVGRYSVLSSAGLLISEVAGIDSCEVLKGAKDMLYLKCSKEELWENPAYLFAAMLYLMSIDEKRNINVMMPYADGLKAIAEWFCQLWAESLGKLGFGLTPYPSVGTTDQHSQLQLWMDGPEDKVVIFIHIDDYTIDIKIPDAFKDYEGCAYLAGHTLSEVIKAAENATELSLSDASKPNMTIKIPTIDAYHIGQLFQFFEISTVVIGFLFGVNPFNQPWIEAGKNNIYGMLGKPGFQKERDDIKRMKKDNICWKL